MLAPSPSVPSVAELRARIASNAVSARPALPFGIVDLDRHLAGGGVATDSVHEVAGASPGLSDDAAATLFVAGLAARFASKRDGGQVLWALTRFDLYSPGLEQAGLPANMLLFAQGRDDAEVLALAEDGLREGALAVVIAEVKCANMVATRRLQLAASEGGVPVVILRRWRRAASCPLSEPSAAITRWRIGSVPSARLGLPGVGRAGWQVELVRQRGGEPLSLLLEACDGVRLPFLADDLFINFDDGRARAGFEVLSELAATTQVLFFTHHAHLVDIAREVAGVELHSECLLS